MIEKLQGLLNFANSDGEVKTYFDGRITQTQLIVIILAVIALIILRKVLKGIVRTLIMVGVACFALVYFGVASPTQIKDTAKTIQDKGIATYQTMAKSSDNIQVKGKDVQIKVGNEWYSVSDIKSVVNVGATLSIRVGDKTVAIDDKQVIDLIKTFSD